MAGLFPIKSALEFAHLSSIRFIGMSLLHSYFLQWRALHLPQPWIYDLTLRLPRGVDCNTRSGLGTRSSTQPCFRAARPSSPDVARPCHGGSHPCVLKSSVGVKPRLSDASVGVVLRMCFEKYNVSPSIQAQERDLQTMERIEVSMMPTDVWTNVLLQSCTSTYQRKRR